MRGGRLMIANLSNRRLTEAAYNQPAIAYSQPIWRPLSYSFGQLISGLKYSIVARVDNSVADCVLS